MAEQITPLEFTKKDAPLHPYRAVFGPHAKDPKDFQGWHATLNAYWEKEKINWVDQTKLDVLMWKGAIENPGNDKVAKVLNKLFYLIKNYGVAINKDSGEEPKWSDGSDEEIPIASYLSHGGRIIIQLPVRTIYENKAKDLWLNLNEDVILPRSTSTHSLKNHVGRNMINADGRKYRFNENRSPATGFRGYLKSFFEENNFGMNVALGGCDFYNPWTNQKIGREGSDGHLYMYYNEKNVGQCGGIMIGCENSDVDRVSQTGILHDYRAISEDRSPCGTEKWDKIYKRFKRGSPNKKDAFLIDLSYGFDLPPEDCNLVGDLANRPENIKPPNFNLNPHRTLIYVLKDITESGWINFYWDAKEEFEDHLLRMYEPLSLSEALSLYHEIRDDLKHYFNPKGLSNGCFRTLYLRGITAIEALLRHGK